MKTDVGRERLRPAVISAFVCAALHAAPSVGNTPATVRVTDEGRAAGVDMGAEDEAIQDAKRNAVRKGCGELITASTVVENYELFEDRILSKAAGYIVDSGTKIRCEKDTTNNITVCSIDALVASAKLDEVIKAVKWKAPRITVVATDSINTLPGSAPTLSASLQAKVEKLFRDAGYRITDQAVVQKNLEKLIAAAKLEGNLQQRADLVKMLESEIVAWFEVSCPPCHEEKLPPPHGTIFVCDASLAYKVVQLDKAESIDSDSVPANPPVHSNGPRANMKELLGFVSKEGGKVVKQVKQKIDANVVDTRSIDVMFVFGEDFENPIDEFRKVRSEIRRIRGIEDFTIRQGMGSTILTEIAYRYPTDRLAQAIVEMESEAYAYKTMDVSQDTLRIEVRKK